MGFISSSSRVPSTLWIGNWLLCMFQMSPPERDHVAFVHGCLDKLGRAVGQVDETLLVLTIFLQYNHGNC